MKISVALCSYNGAPFLAAQLASLAAQDRLPDELVICDDCSDDDTPALVRKFAEQAPFPVRLFQNPRRLGSTGNFERAIELCEGDVIVLADQDDVWMRQKIGQLERALAASPTAGFTFSDASIVDVDRRPLPYTLWQAIRFSRREQNRMRAGRALDVLLKHYVVTGATMAFRAEYKPLVLPIPPSWIHDAWIALLIGAVAPCELVAEPLIEYRQHPRQQFGEKRRSLLEQFRIARTMTQQSYRTVAEVYALASARLREAAPARVPAETLAALDGKIAHFRTRTQMRDPRTWRLPLVIAEVASGRYARYSLGWKSIAQDLFL